MRETKKIHRILGNSIYILSFVGLLYLSTLHTVAQTTLSNKFVLITSLYNENDPARIKEYLYCLEKNLNHPLIESIHVIYDASKDANQTLLLDYIRARRLKVDYTNDRPTYDFCFSLANRLYPGKLVILANADIYFNETLHLLDGFDWTNKFIVLTRWNLKNDGSLEIFKQYNSHNGAFNKYDSECSQDAWIFLSPIRGFGSPNSIQLGTFHCDSRIAFYAQKSGYTVLNPCLTIQACHVHLTPVRHYAGTVELDKLYRHELLPVSWTTL